MFPINPRDSGNHLKPPGNYLIPSTLPISGLIAEADEQEAEATPLWFVVLKIFFLVFTALSIVLDVILVVLSLLGMFGADALLADVTENEATAETFLVTLSIGLFALSWLLLVFHVFGFFAIQKERKLAILVYAAVISLAGTLLGASGPYWYIIIDWIFVAGLVFFAFHIKPNGRNVQPVCGFC